MKIMEANSAKQNALARMSQTIWVYNAQPKDIRELIKSAGNTIGSVHFLKRKDGSLRKMSYRLHVQNPTTAKKPSDGVVSGVDTAGTDVFAFTNGLNVKYGGARPDGSRYVVVNPGGFTKGFGPARKDVDLANDQMTVLDANKIVKDANGEVVGRGAWRTIPLESVVQITVKGIKYIVKN